MHLPLNNCTLQSEISHRSLNEHLEPGAFHQLPLPVFCLTFNHLEISLHHHYVTNKHIIIYFVDSMARYIIHGINLTPNICPIKKRGTKLCTLVPTVSPILNNQTRLLSYGRDYIWDYIWDFIWYHNSHNRQFVVILCCNEVR